MESRALFSFRHALAVCFALAALVPAVGCGRSGLDDYLPTDAGLDAKLDSPIPDGGDGGACSPATCPNGCCAGGVCRTGNEFAACGAGGQACDDCAAANYDYCDPDLRQCAKDQPTCDSISCPTGCCLVFNGKNVCVTGTSGVACGTGGSACADCNAKGAVCDTGSHACVAPTCGPQNCKGCCAGNVCVAGTDVKTCGVGGLQCADCASKGQTCDTQTGTCFGPPPTCNAQNCPNGCCQGNVCIAPTSDKACGKPGAQCQDCTPQGGKCQTGACVVPPTCTVQNCAAGCCSGNICYAGFLNNRCGSGGNACADCTVKASTCNTGVTPRVCNSQQTTCPAAYPSCPANTTTPILPVTKGVCGAPDLADAKQACQGGAGTFACDQFFATIASINPACGKCLAPFDYPFQEATGIYNCVAPYVGAQCDHATGCATQCQDTSCAQCPANSTSSCRTSVRQGGQCQTYFQQTQCVINGLFGQGQFCSPQTYQGNYGNWLAGVGAHYCL